LSRELLSVERRYRFMLRRAGLFDAIEKAFERNFYSDEEDAVSRARERHSTQTAARDRAREPPEPAGFLRELSLFDLANEREEDQR
jgi:DNA sulfur modification protein DndC